MDRDNSIAVVGKTDIEDKTHQATARHSYLFPGVSSISHGHGETRKDTARPPSATFFDDRRRSMVVDVDLVAAIDASNLSDHHKARLKALVRASQIR
jgi:hypothetical protein